VSEADFRTGPTVVNDTRGTVSCVHRDPDRGRRFAGTIEPDDERRIPSRSSCSVFKSDGDYVGCVEIPKGAPSDQRFKASSAQSGVKAGVCAYPR
jgi:hypothetical protein